MVCREPSDCPNSLPENSFKATEQGGGSQTERSVFSFPSSRVVKAETGVCPGDYGDRRTCTKRERAQADIYRRIPSSLCTCEWKLPKGKKSSSRKLQAEHISDLTQGREHTVFSAAEWLLPQEIMNRVFGKASF